MVPSATHVQKLREASFFVKPLKNRFQLQCKKTQEIRAKLKSLPQEQEIQVCFNQLHLSFHQEIASWEFNLVTRLLFSGCQAQISSSKRAPAIQSRPWHSQSTWVYENNAGTSATRRPAEFFSASNLNCFLSLPISLIHLQHPLHPAWKEPEIQTLPCQVIKPMTSSGKDGFL